jgi:hypothetical protein
MASDSESDYERETADAASTMPDNGFSIGLFIDRAEEMQKKDQLEILEKLTLDNSLLQHLVIEYQRQWCRTIDLLEQVQKAVCSLQEALEYCFNEHMTAERTWLAFWGIGQGSTAPHRYNPAGWI